MTLENAVNIQGPLVDTLPQLNINTIAHADEIVANKRKIRAEFRNNFFWTADFPLYHVEGNEVVLYLARGKDNLIFNNLEDAVQQLMGTENYIPDKKEAEAIIKQETTLKIRYSQLKHLKRGGQIWPDNQKNRFTIFKGSTYNESTPDEQAFSKRVFGHAHPLFWANTIIDGLDVYDRATMFKSDGDIFVLNQDYVRSHATKNGFLARVGCLHFFSYAAWYSAQADFHASDFGICDSFGWVRGVLKNEKAGRYKNIIR